MLLAPNFVANPNLGLVSAILVGKSEFSDFPTPKKVGLAPQIWTHSSKVAPIDPRSKIRSDFEKSTKKWLWGRFVGVLGHVLGVHPLSFRTFVGSQTHQFRHVSDKWTSNSNSPQKIGSIGTLLATFCKFMCHEFFVTANILKHDFRKNAPKWASLHVEDSVLDGFPNF